MGRPGCHPGAHGRPPCRSDRSGLGQFRLASLCRSGLRRCRHPRRRVDLGVGGGGQPAGFRSAERADREPDPHLHPWRHDPGAAQHGLHGQRLRRRRVRLACRDARVGCGRVVRCVRPGGSPGRARRGHPGVVPLMVLEHLVELRGRQRVIGRTLAPLERLPFLRSRERPGPLLAAGGIVLECYGRKAVAQPTSSHRACPCTNSSRVTSWNLSDRTARASTGPRSPHRTAGCVAAVPSKAAGAAPHRRKGRGPGPRATPAAPRPGPPW